MTDMTGESGDCTFTTQRQRYLKMFLVFLIDYRSFFYELVVRDLDWRASNEENLEMGLSLSASTLKNYGTLKRFQALSSYIASELPSADLAHPLGM